MAGDPRVYYRNHTIDDTTTEWSGAAGDPALSIQTLGFSAPEGYIFNEWNTARDGSGTSVAVGEAFPGNVLYAIWGNNFTSYLTTNQELTSVANAIRTKGGTSAALEYPTGFVTAIGAIQSGTPKTAQTYYPSTSDQTIASGYRLTGTQTFKGVLLTNLTAGNIKKDVVVKIGDSTDDDCVTSITGIYEGGGIPSNLAAFTIDQGSSASFENTMYTYFFETGMTWSQFIASSYNTTNSFTEDMKGRILFGGSIVYYGSPQVTVYYDSIINTTNHYHAVIISVV